MLHRVLTICRARDSFVHHGLSPAAISKLLVKDDGISRWTETAIHDAVNKLSSDPKWRGERSVGSGRPRKTTKKQDRDIVKHVDKERGRSKVTVKSIKRQFPALRKVSNTLVEERLNEASYAYLRRRRKSKVGKAYLQDRIDYCNAVNRKRNSTLERWAYTDGTVYYLDRTAGEHEQTQAAALGAMVWRRTDRSDALYQDCLGPSGYNKAQGTPVRVWGMLASGVLHIRVLDVGEVMNTDVYCELVEEHFEQWMAGCTELVCDFERCIRSAAAVAELERVGLRVVDNYPKCSQDFNAIENAWGTYAETVRSNPLCSIAISIFCFAALRNSGINCFSIGILKERLDQTLPQRMESREDFILRLRAAVTWANRHRASELWYLSTNQKERAQDCLNTLPPGGRTKW